MSIFDKIDGLLKILDIPFYEAVAEFPENEEPPLYVVYSLYDCPTLWGDGKVISNEYVITVNILGNDVKKIDELQNTVLGLFQDYDFVYAGCSYQIDTDYPAQYRRIIDFKYYL